MEAGSSAYRVAGHELVHHPSRGPARDYFERYGGDTAIINGLSTRSVSHEVCAVVATTGTTRGNTPDSQALSHKAALFFIACLVLGGPSFPGSLEACCAVVVARRSQSWSVTPAADSWRTRSGTRWHLLNLFWTDSLAGVHRLGRRGYETP